MHCEQVIQFIEVLRAQEKHYPSPELKEAIRREIEEGDWSTEELRKFIFALIGEY